MFVLSGRMMYNFMMQGFLQNIYGIFLDYH